MKNIIKNLFAIALLMSLSSVAMAQEQSATITANASVISDIAVGADKQNIDFSDIIVGTAKFISAFDQSVTLQNGEGVETGTEQIGWFDISVSTGVNVDLTLTVPTELSDGSNTLPISFDATQFNTGADLNGFVTADDPSTNTSPSQVTGGEATSFTPNNSGIDPTEWNLDNPFTMPSGTVYLVLGGEVSSASDQTVGSYSADITLTATITD